MTYQGSGNQYYGVGLNPTPVNYVNWRTPETIPAGTTISVPTPANTFNCASRLPAGTAIYTLNGQIKCGYIESKKGSISKKMSDPITVLAKKDTPFAQMMAFDLDDLSDWDA